MALLDRSDVLKRIPWLALVAAAVVLAVVAARYLWRLPLETLLRDWSVDDTFYYLATARHLAESGRSTFDGVNLTNGYHPVWLLTIAPVFWLGLSGRDAYYVVKCLEVGLALGSFVCVAYALRRARAGWAVLFVVLAALTELRAAEHPGLRRVDLPVEGGAVALTVPRADAWTRAAAVASRRADAAKPLPVRVSPES